MKLFMEKQNYSLHSVAGQDMIFVKNGLISGHIEPINLINISDQPTSTE